MTQALPPWPANRTLRGWQQFAFDDWLAKNPFDYLVEATPGSGKTIFALRLGHFALSGGCPQFTVVCPTAHLRKQWRDNAREYGIQLRTEIPAGLKEERTYHGAALTYAQVATAPTRYGNLYGRGMVVFDEIHHAGEGKSWGDALRIAFTRAPQRVQLTGTPFRGDGSAIPFIRYTSDGESEADYRFGYGDALAAGAVRPIFFVFHDGEFEWQKDGKTFKHSFGEVIPKDQQSARLRTALDPEGNWMRETLLMACRRLIDVRSRRHRDAAALAVCMNIEHAKVTASLLHQLTGIEPVVVLSDDAHASAQITKFGKSTAPWIVAVGMVSEGTDIPRLRVGAWLTNVSAELFFRQVVGRIVRDIKRLSDAGIEQDAYFYLPRDPTLVAHAKAIARERKSKLEMRTAGDKPPPERPPVTAKDDSMAFKVLAADGGEATLYDSHGQEQGAEDKVEGEREIAARLAESLGLKLSDVDDLMAASLKAVGMISDDMCMEDRTLTLRSLLDKRVGEYARLSGRTKAAINRDLYSRAEKPVDELDEVWLNRHIDRIEERTRDFERSQRRKQHPAGAT